MIEPPVPPDLDLRDFAFMPLDVMRLIDSDLTALATGDEFKAAVVLWCKSWHQVPASSLPDDDRLLAHLSGYGKDLRSWKKVKNMALRGFEKASDGRLYHKVIAEKALEAGTAKRSQRARTEAATLARKSKSRQRDDEHNPHRDDQRHEQRDDARNVHQGTGTGTGTGTGKIESPPLPPLAGFSELELAMCRDEWNRVAAEKSLPKVQVLTDERRAKLRQRLAECGGVNGFLDAVGKVRDSPFLTGENAQGWRADFDFILQKKSFTKLMEGSYASVRKSGGATTLETIAATFGRGHGEGSEDVWRDRARDVFDPADIAK